LDGNELRPVFPAGHKPIHPILGLENRCFAFLHIEPVLAQCIDDVGFMRDEKVFLPFSGICASILRRFFVMAITERTRCERGPMSLLIAELPKKNRAFLTAPALAGISSDLMQSQGAMDHCRRRPIGLCADAQIP
jgi:hypothetical protein